MYQMQNNQLRNILAIFSCCLIIQIITIKSVVAQTSFISINYIDSLMVVNNINQCHFNYKYSKKMEKYQIIKTRIKIDKQEEKKISYYHKGIEQFYIIRTNGNRNKIQNFVFPIFTWDEFKLICIFKCSKKLSLEQIFSEMHYDRIWYQSNMYLVDTKENKIIKITCNRVKYTGYPPSYITDTCESIATFPKKVNNLEVYEYNEKANRVSACYRDFDNHGDEKEKIYSFYDYYKQEMLRIRLPKVLNDFNLKLLIDTNTKFDIQEVESYSRENYEKFFD